MKNNNDVALKQVNKYRLLHIDAWKDENDSWYWNDAYTTREEVEIEEGKEVEYLKSLFYEAFRNHVYVDNYGSEFQNFELRQCSDEMPILALEKL